MNPYMIFLSLGCVLSATAVVISVLMIRKKIQAREILIKRLAKDATFLGELQHLHQIRDEDHHLVVEEIERLHALIRQCLAELNERDRFRIEASLYQTSRAGRQRYIEKLAEDAEHLQHSGV